MRRGGIPSQVHTGQVAPPAERFLERLDLSDYQVIARGGEGDGAPDISVVIPTRDRRNYLADTLRALLQQDAHDLSYEIIVVDNCSSDGTSALLEETAATARVPLTGILSKRNRGPAASRNAGLLHARGRIVAFTDSDCVPTPGWLNALRAAFAEGAGAVQGRTVAHPDQAQPLFNHFIETLEFDGSYSTSNVAYLREAAVAAGGFDPGCSYWEDVDLGWRVHRAGWRSAFSHDALVYHQVMRLTAVGWLRNAWHYHIWPAKAARYPEFRAYLFLRIWSDRTHALFQAFALGIALTRWRPVFALLAVPYIAYTFRRRWVGRWPLVRAAVHVLRDGISLAALVSGSIRFRGLVL